MLCVPNWRGLPSSNPMAAVRSYMYENRLGVAAGSLMRAARQAEEVRMRTSGAGDGGATRIAQELPATARLQIADLSYSGIGNDGAYSLAEALANGLQLVELDLRGLRFGCP